MERLEFDDSRGRCVKMVKMSLSFRRPTVPGNQDFSTGQVGLRSSPFTHPILRLYEHQYHWPPHLSLYLWTRNPRKVQDRRLWDRKPPVTECDIQLAQFGYKCFDYLSSGKRWWLLKVIVPFKNHLGFFLVLRPCGLRRPWMWWFVTPWVFCHSASPQTTPKSEAQNTRRITVRPPIWVSNHYTSLRSVTGTIQVINLVTSHLPVEQIEYHKFQWVHVAME